MTENPNPQAQEPTVAGAAEPATVPDPAVAEPTQAVEAEQTAEPTQLAEPTQAAEAAQPVATAEAAEPTQLIAPEPAATELVPPPPPEPKPKKPRKKRAVSTADLYLGALLLAIVGGTAAGYTMQALRSPTPLPPLAVTRPVYPPSQIYTGARPGTLPAAQDDATVANGDLTKLLLPTPSGATVPDYAYDHSWQSIASAADQYTSAGDRYKLYLSSGVLRIADTAWKQGDVYVEIQIFQYAPGSSKHAVQLETDAASGNFGETSIPMPNGVTAQGRAYKLNDGTYSDYAVAVHGDLAVVVFTNAPNGAPDPQIIDNLITQQMARL